MLVHLRLALADAAVRQALTARLADARCDVVVTDPARAGQLATDRFDIAVLDGPALDVAWLPKLRALPDRPVLVVIDPDLARASDLLRAGADTVLAQNGGTESLGAALLAIVERRRQHRLSRARLSPGHRPEIALVADSPGMLGALDRARKVANADSPVLILGETGVGKERIAGLVHAESPRRDGPLVTVNCAALPSELFESELFGHARGAFTGAHRAQKGLFERAHGGVLLLDEVGEMPLPLQAKLLRAIDDQRIRPVGADEAVHVDARIVAATNRDLLAEVEAGRFRRDLYYRLCVVEIRVPPLRDRPQDIPALTDAYLHLHAELLGRDVNAISDAARTAMARYPWPGNVRELANAIERAVLLCADRIVTIADLPHAVARYAPASAALEAVPEPPLELPTEVHTLAARGEIALPPAWIERSWKEVRATLLLEGEREYLTALLRQEHGRVGEVARRAGISTRALFDKMRRHDLHKEDFRE